MVVIVQVMNSHSLSGNKLGDFCDGELFLSSQLFQEHPCALQIQLYYDEVEVCNPIGTKTKKHKLSKFHESFIVITFIITHIGLVYYLLGNLDPKLRSTLKSIQLLCIAKYTVIVKYGIEEILRPIVESVQKLEMVGIIILLLKQLNIWCNQQESGVQFLFDGVMTSFRGTITALSADNLAAWSIGGFKALASAFRKCQYCMVVDADMQTKVCIYPFPFY